MALQREHPSVETAATSCVSCKIGEVDDGAIRQRVEDWLLLETEWRCRVLPGQEQQQRDHGDVGSSARGKRGSQYHGGRDPGRKRDDGVVGGIEYRALKAVYLFASIAGVGLEIVDVVDTEDNYK